MTGLPARTQKPHYRTRGIGVELRWDQSRPDAGRGDTIGEAAMMRLRRGVLALVALALVGGAPGRAAEQCDLVLVLAVRVPRGSDHPKFLLQRARYRGAGA